MVKPPIPANLFWKMIQFDDPIIVAPICYDVGAILLQHSLHLLERLVFVAKEVECICRNYHVDAAVVQGQMFRRRIVECHNARSCISSFSMRKLFLGLIDNPR